MDGFNTDGFNYSSLFFDQQDYPWVTDDTGPTFLSDDSAATYLNSNVHQDIASNISVIPYNASLDILPGQGFYGDGVIDSFDRSAAAPLDTANQHFAPQDSQGSQDFDSVYQDYQSNTIFPPLDMIDAVPEQLQVPQSVQQPQADENESLNCIFNECESKEVFSTKAAFKKHQDKHTRPYNCTQSSCIKTSFGDKASLQRHEREVHCSEASAFFCPIVSCKRNKRGFHRKYNLLEHQRRRHGLRSPAFSEESSERGNSQENLFDGERAQTEERDKESNSLQDMKKELQRLRSMRAEIDEDIASLERAVVAMEGGSV